eukprot:1180962-Prorocentrum_minimum.AAC.2
MKRIMLKPKDIRIAIFSELVSGLLHQAVDLRKVLQDGVLPPIEPVGHMPQRLVTAKGHLYLLRHSPLLDLLAYPRLITSGASQDNNDRTGCGYTNAPLDFFAGFPGEMQGSPFAETLQLSFRQPFPCELISRDSPATLRRCAWDIRVHLYRGAKMSNAKYSSKSLSSTWTCHEWARLCVRQIKETVS